jgi:hypothetical protein
MTTKYIPSFEPIRHHLNAAVGDNGAKYDLFDYANAYFDACLVLSSKVTNQGVITDSVVYPICFTFRHGIELFVKYLIDDLGRLTGTWDEFKPGHTLLRNWKRAKRLLNEIETSLEDIEFFEKVVRDLDRVDRNGLTFRYPETIDRNPLIKDLKTINIAVIGNNCQGLSEIANTWRRRLDSALEQAVDNGTISPTALRPTSKRPPTILWRRFLRFAKDAGRRLVFWRQFEGQRRREVSGTGGHPVRRLLSSIAGLFGAATYLVLVVGALPGWVYWLWMAIQLKSFWMFLYAFLGPFGMIAAVLGFWSLIFGIPAWLFHTVT